MMTKLSFCTPPPNLSMVKALNHSQTIGIVSDQISLGSQAKNLGVILDSSLSMDTRITSTCKAANYHLYRLSRIRKYLTLEDLKKDVHAIISLKLDYCNSLLIGLPMTQIGKLQNFINSVAGLISGVKKFKHISPVLKDLHWLPFIWRIEFKLLCMTYKSLNGQAPQYPSDVLKAYTPTRALRSTDHGLLCIPKTRS